MNGLIDLNALSQASFSDGDGPRANAEPESAIDKLKARMRSADWWYDYSDDSSVRQRGAKEVSDLYRDLAILAQDDLDGARQLWEELAPKEIGAPDFLSQQPPSQEPAPAPQENSIGPASVSAPKAGENWLEDLMEFHNAKPAAPESGHRWLDYFRRPKLFGDSQPSAAEPQLRKKPDLRVVPNVPAEPATAAESKPAEAPATGAPQQAKPAVSESDIPAPDVRQAQQILTKYRVTEHKDTKLFIPSSETTDKVAFAVFKDAIKSSAEDSDTACGMVAAAIASGWNPIRASGSAAFQSKIFLHACRLGVVIEDFTPTADDLAALRKEQIPLPAWASRQNQIEPARVKHPAPEPGM